MILRFLNDFIDFVLPPRCAGCRHPGALLCRVCTAKMHGDVPPLCLNCGQESGVQTNCLACHQPGGRIYAPFAYLPPLTNIIQAYKYSGHFALARPLGGLMSDYATPLYQTREMAAPVLVPIPLHSARERERGFNQSALLARQLSRSNGWLVVEGVLTRRRSTQAQAHLTGVERRHNVAGAFCAPAAAVVGRTILLVDDVCTTGSTLKAAADALYAAGAAVVDGLCLARAVGRRSTIAPQIGKNV